MSFTSGIPGGGDSVFPVNFAFVQMGVRKLPPDLRAISGPCLGEGEIDSVHCGRVFVSSFLDHMSRRMGDFRGA